MIAIDFLQKVDAGPGTNDEVDRGVIRLDDDTLIACVTTGGDFLMAEFYASFNNGASWQKQSELIDEESGDCRRMAVLRNKILLVGIVDEANNAISIQKSTDYATTWEPVFEASEEFQPTVDQLELHGARGYDANKAVFIGHLRTQTGGTPSSFITSDPTGTTWTYGPAMSQDARTPQILSIANAGQGRWLIGNGGRINTLIPHDHEGKIHVSNDFGATWHLSGALPAPGDAIRISVNAICALTHDIILAAGDGSSSGTPYYAYLWRSTDGGETWTNISSGNISSWPSTDTRPRIYEIERLAKNAAIFGFYPTLPSGGSPLRASTDAGLTWTTTPTFNGGAGMISGSVQGAICSARNGNLCLTASEVISGNLRTTIYTGELTC